MDLLQNLLGGGQQRQEFEDFVQRYEQGSPYDNISGDEAHRRYQQIAPQLPPDVYQDAARDSFNQMTPQERREFGQYLQQRSRQKGVDFPDLNQDGIDDRYQDPQFLAQMTGRMQQQRPGLLEQLLSDGRQSGVSGGGGMGDLLNNPLAKAALGGIAAMAMRRLMSGGLGGSQGQSGLENNQRSIQRGDNKFGGIEM